jgi:hypothetical protein
MKATAPSGRLLFTEHCAGFGKMTIANCTIERKPSALAALSIAAQRAENFHIHPRDRRRAAGAAPAAIVSAIVKMADHQHNVARALECDRPHRRGAAADGVHNRGDTATPLVIGSQGSGRRWQLLSVVQQILRKQARREWDGKWVTVEFENDWGQLEYDELFVGTRAENQAGIRGKAVIGCGRAIGLPYGAPPGSAPVPVRLTRGDEPGHVRVGGVFRCKSQWLCPQCEVAAAARLCERVRSVLCAVERLGGSAFFLTLTIRHHAGSALAELAALERKAWRSLTNGDPWKRIKRRFGLLGLPKAAEVTDGRNGWHPHYHAVVLSSMRLSDDQQDELAEILQSRWMRAVSRLGGSASRVGQHMRAISSDAETIERYVAKGSLRAGSKAAAEVAGQYAKAGLLPDRLSVGELLALAADADPETAARAASRWLEYALEFTGRRQFVVTASLAAALDLDLDPEDEEGEEVEVATAVPDLEIDWPGWDALSETRHGRAVVVSLVAAGNTEEARFVIDQVISTPFRERRRWRYRNRDQREFDRTMAAVLRRCRAAGFG